MAHDLPPPPRLEPWHGVEREQPIGICRLPFCGLPVYGDQAHVVAASTGNAYHLSCITTYLASRERDGQEPSATRASNQTKEN